MEVESRAIFCGERASPRPSAMAGFCACGRLTNFVGSVGAPVCLSCSMAQGGVIDVWDSDEEIRLSDDVVSNSDGEAMDSEYHADVEVECRGSVLRPDTLLVSSSAKIVFSVAALAT